MCVIANTHTHKKHTHRNAGLRDSVCTDMTHNHEGTHNAFGKRPQFTRPTEHNESNPSWSHPDLLPHRGKIKTSCLLVISALQHVGKWADEEYQVKLEISVSRNTWHKLYFVLVDCGLWSLGWRSEEAKQNRNKNDGQVWESKGRYKRLSQRVKAKNRLLDHQRDLCFVRLIHFVKPT